MRARLFALIALVASCSFNGASGTDGASGKDGSPVADGGDGLIDGMTAIDAPTARAGFRKPITIAAGTVGERLTDFPVYVLLESDSDLRDRAREDGVDIFFVGADGSEALDFEIELWDPATGTLIAWVRRTLDAGAPTTFYVRYGDLGLAQPANPVGVWLNAFEAVFHLNNDPDSPITDSTGARDGTAHSSMDSDDLVDAKLGKGIDLDGGNDVIDFVNPFTGNSAHTISGWVNQRASTDNEAFVVLGTGGAVDQSRFLHTRFFGGTILVGLYGDDFETDDNIQGDGFVLVHWTLSAGAASRLYLDGVLVDGPQNHPGQVNTQGTEGRIGNAPGGASGFGTNMGLNAVLDEVRIASSERPAAWITAEFANQSAPAGFYSIGAEESL